LLFAVLPVISSYASIPGEGHPEELMVAVRVVLVACVFLLAVTGAVYRDLRKAALCVSVCLLVTVGWLYWYRLIDDLTIAGYYIGRRRFVLPLTYLALGGWGIWVYRQQARIPRLTAFANLVALGMVIPPAITLGLQRRPPPNATASSPRPALVATAVTSRPDIYYLVFDRYGDQRTARTYGLDNDIGEYLASKGFYVAGESRTNYIKTVLSLGSTLNLDYLDGLARGREHESSMIPIYEHLAHHRVGAFLRSQGYSYTHLGSWYWPTRENPQATRNISYYTAVPTSVMKLLESVVFAPVQRALEHPWFDGRLQMYRNVKRQLEDVLRLVPEPGPKFVFFHILVPHDPYVFGRDGSFVPVWVEKRRSFAENYTNQVLAANSMIRRLVDRILEDSSSPPVIIVQGDEGPYPGGTSNYRFNWHAASIELLRHRSGILNAYHLPGFDTGQLYPTISPVNTFRVVFNTYFGTNLPLLPDRTFRHTSEHLPYALDDITRELNMFSRDARATHTSAP
jgi:hypothetical protein